MAIMHVIDIRYQVSKKIRRERERERERERDHGYYDRSVTR